MTREEAKELKDKIYKVDFDYEGDDFIDKIYDDFENEIEKTKTKWHKIINGDLPKGNEVYVLHTIYNGVFTGWYENGKWWKPGFSPYSDDEVIAWCEAPKYEG